ncbi:MAG: EAL domain-containing protein [Tepidimonas fonticaldi]|nr:EAL domain-containing protein [Tepidimonas fonticaldi]
MSEADWLALAAAGRWWWHLPTGTEYHDAQWYRLLGLPVTDTPGRYDDWLSRLHPEDAGHALRRVRAAIDAADDQPYDTLFRMRHADGGWRWMHSRGRVVRTPDGTAEWLVGLHTDVTQAMQAVEDLQRAQHWLEDVDALFGGFRFVTWYDRLGQPLRVEYISPGVEALIGVPPDDIMQDIQRFRAHVAPQDLRTLGDTIAHAIRQRAPRFFLRYRLHHGQDPARWRWVQAAATGEYFADGRSRWTGVALDITDWMLAQEHLQNTSEQLQATLATLPDLWFDFDAQGRYVRLHAADPSLMVRPAEELIGKKASDVLPANVAGRIEQALRLAERSAQVQSVAYALELPIGLRHFEARIAPRFRDGSPAGFVAVVRDITHSVHAQQLRERDLTHDRLTGLLNRSGFNLDAARQWWTAHRGPATTLLLLIDIDGLRSLNHAVGTGVGDTLLQQLAARLQQRLPHALCARIGGDEFAVLCQVPDGAACAPWLSDLHAALSEPLQLGQIPYRPSLTMGWVPLDGSDGAWLGQFERALVQVEESLRAAKRHGPGRLEGFDADRFDADRLRHRIGLALPLAIPRAELRLLYQPIVDASGRAQGYEALLRWHSSEFGFVPPADFIPLAEASRTIIPIGAWALQQACRECHDAPAPHLEPVYVCVNVSALQFRQPDFEDTVHAALRASGLPPERLRLEVTESLLIDDLPAVAAKMQRLAQLGVRFALDDFGTGYSNLLQLRSLPLDTIKIDRSFIRDLFTDDNDALIVRSIIELAHRLNLRVVAEGVETAAQAEWLITHGCDALQGYWFGRPGPWGQTTPAG